MTVGPSYDRRLILRVLRTRRATFRRCYETAQERHRGLEGRVVVRWTIDPSGAVQGTHVAASSLRQPAVEACVLDVLRTLRSVPAPGGGTLRIRYPFEFRPA